MYRAPGNALPQALPKAGGPGSSSSFYLRAYQLPRGTHMAPGAAAAGQQYNGLLARLVGPGTIVAPGQPATAALAPAAAPAGAVTAPAPAAAEAAAWHHGVAGWAAVGMAPSLPTAAAALPRATSTPVPAYRPPQQQQQLQPPRTQSVPGAPPLALASAAEAVPLPGARTAPVPGTAVRSAAVPAAARDDGSWGAAARSGRTSAAAAAAAPGGTGVAVQQYNVLYGAPVDEEGDGEGNEGISLPMVSPVGSCLKGGWPLSGLLRVRIFKHIP